MQCKVKICGISSRADLELVAKSGADYGGLLIEIDSIRAHSVAGAAAIAADPPLPVVAVTADRPLRTLMEIEQTVRPFALQLHGFESVEMVRELRGSIGCEIWKVVHLPAMVSDETFDIDQVLSQMMSYVEAGIDKLLVDATVVSDGKRRLGGTGKPVDWNLAKQLKNATRAPLFVAGGINPHNVTEVIQTVHPYGIDLSSGVETAKGKKDPDKVLHLMARVRAWNSPDSGFMNNRVC